MKKRIIPAILLNQGTQVSLSLNYSPWRSVGALVQNLRLHVARGADELLIINLNKTSNTGFNISLRILNLIRQEVDIPISYVGGLATCADASYCVNSGFDKVFLSSAFFDNFKSVQSVSNVLGSQSVGVVLPYKRNSTTGHAFIWDYRIRSLIGLSLEDAMYQAVACGSGEILLYDVDRDGTLSGLDPLIFGDLAKFNIDIPILVAGGAGKKNHILDILVSPYIQGVVASSIFALTQETPLTIRRFCQENGIAMRRVSSLCNN